MPDSAAYHCLDVALLEFKTLAHGPVCPYSLYVHFRYEIVFQTQTSDIVRGNLVKFPSAC